MSEFRYLTAADWDMRWARVPIGERTPDDETYVHHTAGNHPNNAITAFQQLNEYAINTKGYSAVDYDILVHRDPRSGLVTIGEGRGKYMSAATLDRNEEGEAICLLGYFHPGSTLSRHPHPDEVEGVALGIVWGIRQGWISSATKILGHRDNPAHPGATGCPGDYLYAELPTIRQRVAELLNPPEVPVIVAYFKTSPDSLTIWASSDGLNAVRLEQSVCDARGVNVFTVPALPAGEAGKYVYQAGLTSASVK